MSRTATDIAHWFIHTPGLSKEWSDQARLQKLLFFSWLIHFYNYKKPLFEDDFCAFEYGPVVWDVLYNMDNISTEEFNTVFLPNYTAEELNTFYLTSDIFGDAGCDELIDLSHESPAWEKFYNASQIFDENGKVVDYNRKKQIIPKEEFGIELKMIRNLLYAHKYREELGY
ncbi:MAG: DUF4065 domain-containing protein [Methanimicrococcus sp.]|nr:DUF4065 domain-containing protein [Methanimicrococcus sp.]